MWFMTHGAGRFALVAQAARIPAFDGGSSTWAAMRWEHMLSGEAIGAYA